MRVLGMLLLLALPGLAQDGEWTLVLSRQGMQPQTSKGALVLEKKGKRWSGTLRFPTILYARAHALSDIRVRGKRIEFTLSDPQFTLEFEGGRKGRGFEGTCTWKGLGRYPWTAEPAGAIAPQERFSKGLRFGGEWPQDKQSKLDLDRLILAAEEAQSDALLIVHRGKVVCERYFRKNRGKIHVMSVTKFVTAMAVALLIDEGKIESLDAPLSTWFPEWKDGAKGKVTLRHVLSHTSGIHRDKDAQGRPNARKLNEAKGKVAYVLQNGLDEEPGTKFEYNNDAIALLSGVIAKAAGKPVDAYVKEKLFAPLGIRDFAWDRDAAGNTFTYANLALTARDLAKIGLLVAHGGAWGGKQVFPSQWIAKLGDKPGSALSDQCGLVWWRLSDPKGYYHTGSLGQYLVIYPDEDLVAIRLRAWDGSEDLAREFGGFIGLLEAALRE